jgi:hypothetical protein
MNVGRVIVMGIAFSALFAGALMYYLQVYGYYKEVAAEVADVQLTALVSGVPEPVVFENFKAIDSNSSPVRYRACFEMPLSLATLTETYVMYDDPVPLIAPGWFDCFDAETLGGDLETGAALAFLGQADVKYGIDRIVAVYPDGRAFSWHQINACGEVVFDGDPVPETCPLPPESMN